MSSHLGNAPAFPFSLERQPSRPTETTADPLQLDSLASRMLGARAQEGTARAGQGRDGLRKTRGQGGLGCEGRCGRHGDGEKGFAPLSAHLQLFMLH